MLSDTVVRNAKAREKPYKLFDGRGLYLLVNPSGSRWWRFKYLRNGKERGISFGVYPDVSLGPARKRREEARTLLAEGGDPSEKKKAEKVAGSNSFRAIAEEWFGLQEGKLATITLSKARRMLESFIYPRLGQPSGDQAHGARAFVGAPL
jgi:hypothetical protein